MILCYTGIDLVRLANDVGAGLGVSDTRVFLFSTFPQSKSVQKISFLPDPGVPEVSIALELQLQLKATSSKSCSAPPRWTWTLTRWP